jgi:NAD kinase
VSAGSERKIVLVTRKTRLEELIARHHTLAQAKFYIEHLGADLSDYLQENAAYAKSLQIAVKAVHEAGRYQIVDRAFVSNFIFAPDDIVVALGQDGLVANVMKYLDGQPLIGVNPEPTRWDGVLLPFRPEDLPALLPEVGNDGRQVKSITLAEARLSDGQMLRAANDLFIGPRTHTSALYEIEVGGRREFQSSSGLIVSTGLGSTAWMKSIVTGSMGITQSIRGTPMPVNYKPQPWDTAMLTFAVREPFPSRSSKSEIVFGHVTAKCPMKLRSRMPENGVIFSDGIESDFLRFTAGMEATITVASAHGNLIC